MTSEQIKAVTATWTMRGGDNVNGQEAALWETAYQLAVLNETINKVGIFGASIHPPEIFGAAKEKL